VPLEHVHDYVVVLRRKVGPDPDLLAIDQFDDLMILLAVGIVAVVAFIGGNR
jgi:hypothetical protein